MGRRKRNLLGTQDAKVDLSPMIDLVFLLLIFFMVASTLITYKKDKRVNIPIALDAQVPEIIEYRTIINVYADGTFGNEGGHPITLDEITAIMTKAKSESAQARLHVRADKKVAHEKVRDVISASAEGGVSNVIFSSFVTDK